MAQIPDNIRAAIKCLLEPYGLDFELVHPSGNTRKRFMDVKSAEEYSSLGRWTLYRATMSGQLPQIKISSAKSGKVLYDIKDLDRYITAHKGNKYSKIRSVEE